MPSQYFWLSPLEKQDFSINITDEIGSDTISAVVWTTAGLTNESQSNTSGVATIWLSGPVVGETYHVKAKITTTAGRIFERNIIIRCFSP